MKATKRAKDETPSEFFSAVRLPTEWKFLGRNNGTDTIGFIYRINDKTVARLWFDLVTKRGGIGTRTDDYPNPPKYCCVIWNKRATALNEWIQNNLIDKENDQLPTAKGIEICY
jgi:hypothetical protein